MVIPLIRIFSPSPQGPNEPLYYYYMSTLFIDPERGEPWKNCRSNGPERRRYNNNASEKNEEEKKKVLSL